MNHDRKAFQSQKEALQYFDAVNLRVVDGLYASAALFQVDAFNYPSAIEAVKSKNTKLVRLIKTDCLRELDSSLNPKELEDAMNKLIKK
jgi:hypothetical protein